MQDKDVTQWFKNHYDIDNDTIIKALEQSPSAQGYIHGAVSEILLCKYLKNCGYEYFRIKEKPSGGFDNKKEGYKGDFLIHKPNSKDYYVIECKGIKTNAEFRGGEEDTNTFLKTLPKKKAINLLLKYYHPNKAKIYEKGLNQYLKTKSKWELKHKGKTFPPFKWDKNCPGPDNADISSYFKSKKEIEDFVNACKDSQLSEIAFRNLNSLFLLIQTHEPSKRVDESTGIDQAAPIVSDFSMMAVDLYQRIGKHKFVFMNPDKISHSPTSPHHLYQNYVIDIIIPGIKDKLNINHPWYDDIDNCIVKTKPRKVKYDESQIDHR